MGQRPLVSDRQSAVADGRSGAHVRIYSPHLRRRESATPDGNCSTGRPGLCLSGVAAVSASEAWAVGTATSISTAHTVVEQPLVEHWNGKRWSVVPSPRVGHGNSSLSGVAAWSARDVWAVGSLGLDKENAGPLVEHWDGRHWQVVTAALPRAPGSNVSAFSALAVVSAQEVWAVGYHNGRSLIEHRTSGHWRIVPDQSPAYNPTTGPSTLSFLSAVAALHGTDLWAVGKVVAAHDQSDQPLGPVLVEHWDGQRWRRVTSPSSSALSYDRLSAITAVAARDMWAVGTGVAYRSLIEHWDGRLWQVVPDPNIGPLSGVAAASASDVWTVGTGIEHWDGRTWQIIPSPHGPFSGIAIVSATDVWVVGGNVIVHWNGTGWYAVPSPRA